MQEVVTPAEAAAARRAEEDHPGPPAWTHRLVGDPQRAAWIEAAPRRLLRVVAGDGFSLLSARLVDAVALDAETFRDGARELYELLRRELTALSTPHPVRVWNFIPGILEPLGELPHRYMHFNAGRFQAYEAWFRSSEGFELHLPTATGTGQAGAHLDVHCLCARHPGTPVENPRQIAAYRYSPRYGPLPPCFARATRLCNGHGFDWLLVGGTASVTGEDSAHLEDLDAQLEETARNLEALVRRGLGEDGAARAAGAEPLGRFRSLRVYHPRAADAPFLQDALSARFPAIDRLELVRSELCRPELLLEIEGVAILG
jgi:chorismate lyase / 3-hydroxybenzoate synthase